MAELKFPDFAGEDLATLAGTVITLKAGGSAVTNHRTFANAASDTNIDFDDGDEIAVDIIDTGGNTATWTATYASGAGTLTRTNLEAAQGTLSTSAEAITVYASVPGNWFRDKELRVNTTYNSAADHADFTAETGNYYLINLSSMTTRLIVDLPDTARINQRVGFYITATNASYELEIRTQGTGSEFMGVDTSAGTDKWIIWQVSESLIAGCTNAGGTGDTDWSVLDDGRKMTSARIDSAGDSQQGPLSDDTYTKVTNLSNEVYDNGGISNEASDELNIRRDGLYIFTGTISGGTETGTLRVKIAGNSAATTVALSPYDYTSSNTLGQSVTAAYNMDISVFSDIQLQARPSVGGTFNVSAGTGVFLEAVEQR